MSEPDFVITTGAEDLGIWYSEQESADKLNISLRTFQRLVSEGSSKAFAYAPQKRDRRRPGKRPEPVYNPREVDALAAAANMRVVPPAAAPLYAPQQSAGPAITIGGMEFASGEIPMGLQLALGVMDRLAGLLDRHAPAPAQIAAPAPPPAIDVQTKLYLSIDEAALVSGLSKSLLRRLAPHIAIRDGRRWKIPQSNLANTTKLAELAVSLPIEPKLRLRAKSRRVAGGGAD